MNLDDNFEDTDFTGLSGRSIRAAAVEGDFNHLVSLRVDVAQRIDALTDELRDTIDGFRAIGHTLQRAAVQEKRGPVAVVQPRLELYATTRNGTRDVIAALEGRERLAHCLPILKNVT
jgi:hypothetical protein